MTLTPTRELPATRSGGSRRRRSRWRWLRRAIVAVVLVVAVVAAGSVLLLVETPSVADAPTLVEKILAGHDAPSDGGRIPAKVAAALLATEDSRYYGDPALDPRGTLRGLWGFVSRNPDEGGATIEMQLAKLLYTPGDSSLKAEVEQVALAFKLDHSYTKRQILAMYLDAAYFGDGAYGVTDASERYFGLPAGSLSWGQAALLAGLVQAPSDYDPHGHLDLALARRRHVLARLVATGVLTRAQAASVARQPLRPAISFDNEQAGDDGHS